MSCMLRFAIPRNVAGYTDGGIAMNIHGSWASHALAMGMDKDTPLRDRHCASPAEGVNVPEIIQSTKTGRW